MHIEIQLPGLSDVSKGREGGADANYDMRLGGSVWGKDLGGNEG